MVSKQIQYNNIETNNIETNKNNRKINSLVIGGFTKKKYFNLLKNYIVNLPIDLIER